MRPANEEGPPVPGATLPRPQPQLHAPILRHAPGSHKGQAFAIHYARSFVAPLARGRREVFVMLHGSAKKSVVKMVASVAGFAPTAPRMPQ